MNPRIFCREPGYPRAIALTYSFDPLFFERIILRDLWCGGTGDITIVGDHNELQEAISRYAGQFIFLGNKYLLTSAETSGNFHPKLLLRVGPDGARMLLGTGNLTFCGWGGNKEIGLDLKFVATDPQSAEIVNNVLDHIEPYLTTDTAREALVRLRDYPWLINRDDSVDHALMLTRPNESLATQLLARWPSRQFDRMMVFTGSTDEKGGFVNWCQKQFGIVECIVAVSPENASFLQQEIDKLSVAVSLAPFRGSQRLHAKFYWFDGPDGPAAIVGSANCSTAAWLLAPRNNGNVEAVYVYDHPSAEDFTDILKLFPKERESVTRVESLKPEKSEPVIVSPYQLRSIALLRGEGQVEVNFNCSLPEHATVTLIGPDDLSISLFPKEKHLWGGTIAETNPWPENTPLARIVIETEDEVHQPPVHWVDDLDSINRASQVKQILSSFGGLTRSKTSSEHEKVVSDLAMVSSSLFTESASFIDPQLRRRPQDDTTSQKQSEPVKPEDLIKSLNDLEVKDVGQSTSLGPGMHLSMFGVMRALFEESESSTDEKEILDEENLSGVDIDEGGEGAEQKDSSQKKKSHREPPPDKYKQRLREQMGVFFENFSGDTFSKECTATKMVQASAYPLAVALLGERGHWLSSGESRTYVTKTVDILLNRQRPNSAARGLLAEVGERYKSKDQYEVYQQVVGDGTLWIALLATLSQLTWEENFERFEKAINLYKVYDCDVLRSDTSIGKLGALVTRIQVEKARLKFLT